MSDPYLGQIMLTGFNFAPRGFATCDGQTLPIVQNQALFALLGTMYGGNGTTTFQLPDLRGRTPLGFTGNTLIGTASGVETVTLTSSELPAHAHDPQASTSAGATRNPADGLFASSGSENLYASTSGPQVTLNPATIAATGNGQPHSNMQPYNVLNFCIALNGISPPHN